MKNLLHDEGEANMKAITTTPKSIQRNVIPGMKISKQLTGDINEQIRCRAYQLFQERGQIDGRDLDDWLRAESEILYRKQC